MLLNDVAISDLCIPPEGHPYWDDDYPGGLFLPMIDPFSEAVSGDGVISYGLSHAGYDLRLAPEVWIFNNSYGEAVDPKRFKDPEYVKRMFVVIKPIEPCSLASVTIPAHGYALGRSFEYLRMPDHLKGRCVGKSTYARCGLIVNTTPVEPGWEGHLTIEISNSNPSPAVVYLMEGICQLEFEQLTAVPAVTYKGKKYDVQNGVTPAKVD